MFPYRSLGGSGACSVGSLILKAPLMLCVFLFLSLWACFYLDASCVSQLHGVLRVVMEPLLGDMPLIGALSLFFLKKPVSSSPDTHLTHTSSFYHLELRSLASLAACKTVVWQWLFYHCLPSCSAKPVVLSLQTYVLPKHLANLSQIRVPSGETGALNRHRSG